VEKNEENRNGVSDWSCDTNSTPSCLFGKSDPLHEVAILRFDFVFLYIFTSDILNANYMKPFVLILRVHFNKLHDCFQTAKILLLEL